MRYKTKPFEIEAILFDGENYSELSDFTGDRFFHVVPEDREDEDCVAEVWDYLHATWVGVKKGQFIIKGNKGEFYPCDPEIFEAKYEAMPV